MVIYGNNFIGGDVTVPPSKSIAHRAIICAALSRDKSVISNIDDSKDMQATLGAVRALGVKADYDKTNKTVFINSEKLGHITGGKIDCIESGSTLRFLIPIAAAIGKEWQFVGSGRLPERPLGVFENLLPRHGVSFETQGGLPLKISGKLTCGEYRLPGNVSSQFITGLLFALPILQGDSDVILTSPLESEGYVDLTVSVLKEFGIQIEKTSVGWHIRGNQRYSVKNYTVEGDWSQAAFFLSMAALAPNGERVNLHGLDKNSLQGDRACVDIFGNFGLKTEWNGDILTAWNPNPDKPFFGLHGCVIDAAQIPDMVPSLAACAALCKGETRIINAQRLRLKESDRLAAMESAINSVGGVAKATPDGLIIQGVSMLNGGIVNGENDHRIVMAMAACALKSCGKISVTDESSIKKSYPNFFNDFKSLGGVADVINVGRTH